MFTVRYLQLGALQQFGQGHSKMHRPLAKERKHSNSEREVF